MELFSIDPIYLLSMPGGTEWLWIILAVIILFGGKKIPELAKGIGKGMREFKDAKDGIRNDIETEMKKKEEIETVKN